MWVARHGAILESKYSSSGFHNLIIMPSLRVTSGFICSVAYGWSPSLKNSATDFHSVTDNRKYKMGSSHLKEGVSEEWLLKRPWSKPLYIWV